MKRMLALGFATLVMASRAFAQGGVTSPGTMNLAWNDCWLGVTEAMNLNSACTSTTGIAAAAYGSFDPPSVLPQFVGMSAVVDLQTTSPGGTLSPWWRFDLARNSCHGQRLVHSADFIADPGSCADFFGGQASGGGNFQTPGPFLLSPSARIREIWAVALSSAAPVNPGTEYYAFKFVLLNSLNDGYTLDQCPGCLDAACIVLGQMNLAQPAPTPDVILSSGAQTFITWQGGTGSHACPGALPARRTSWGAIKSIYR